MTEPIVIGIVGDFEPTAASHHATNEALRHAADHLAVDLDWNWVGTPQLEERAAKSLECFDGIWAAPGTPRSPMGVLEGIRFARERMWPFFGT